MIARFRTTGRWCDNKGGKTIKGCGLRAALDRFEGNRVMRIDRIERASMRDSEGVSCCLRIG